MARGGPIVAYGTLQVAEWLGVGQSVVSNWIRRHPADVPQPDVVLMSPSGWETWGWFAERREEWQEWHSATG